MSTLLIADDEQAIRHYLIRAAASLGHECLEASDGISAREVYQSHAVDLVILDVQMPGKDGIALLHEIKELDPHAVVIIMTGYPSADDIIATIEDDGYTYIAKPLALEKIKDLIESGLTHRRRLVRDAASPGESDRHC